MYQQMYVNMTDDQLLEQHEHAVNAKYFFIDSARNAIQKHNLPYAQHCRLQAQGWRNRLHAIERLLEPTP